MVLRDLSQIDFFNKIKLDNFFFLFTNSNGVPVKSNFSIIKSQGFRLYLWDISHYIRRKLYELENFNTNISNQTLELDNKKLLIIKIIFILKCEKVVLYLLDIILDLTISKSLKKIAHVDEIFFIGSPKDLNFDDLMTIAKKNNIKTKLIFTNWDNATTKPYKIKPDKVYCWGEETSFLSKKIHGISSESVGSIRFENHLYNKEKYKNLTKDIIKKKLNLSLNFNYILFAGVTFPFSELKSLKILNQVINNKKLNVRILYKPHPYGRVKIPQKNIDQLENINYLKDSSENNFEEYYFLLNSIEGVISPFSTLVLEGIFFNKPALCLAYNDENYKIFNWEMNSKYQPHLQILREFKFPYWCYNSVELEKTFLIFFKNLRKDQNNSYIHNEIIKRSVFFDNTKYIDRLNNIFLR